MTIKKIATFGSILAALALSASAAWANCQVSTRTAIGTPISCQTTRGGFTASSPAGTNPSNTVTVSLSNSSPAGDFRSREARASGFSSNGTIRCTAIVFRNTGNVNSGSNTVNCSQPIVTHTVSLTASLFP